MNSSSDVNEFETKLPRITFDEAFLGVIFAGLCIFFAVSKGTWITHISAVVYGLVFIGISWYYFNAMYVCGIQLSATQIKVTWKNRAGKEKHATSAISNLFYKFGHTGVKGALLTLDLVKKEKDGFNRRPRFMRMVTSFGWKFDDLARLRAACDAVGIVHLS
ncbi:hypothetical protein ACE38W_03660 [Chitinophaga sp. Hz27]|uniref:hypothetical protein n=1 Tax=Chitinophaga sp. Hz27 TaxID=3347169 RepID=UPI0035D706A0